MKHLREMTLDDLRAVADNATALDRLCHEMLRRDGEVTLAEAEALMVMREPGQRLPEWARQEFVKHGNEVSTWRRPAESFCRPDVPLDRLMALVQGVREWTGRDVRVEVYQSPSGIFGGFLRSDNHITGVEHLMRAADAHVSIILACLAYCIVYGEKT